MYVYDERTIRENPTFRFRLNSSRQDFRRDLDATPSAIPFPCFPKCPFVKKSTGSESFFQFSTVPPQRPHIFVALPFLEFRDLVVERALFRRERRVVDDDFPGAAPPTIQRHAGGIVLHDQRRHRIVPLDGQWRRPPDLLEILLDMELDCEEQWYSKLIPLPCEITHRAGERKDPWSVGPHYCSPATNSA